MIVSLQGTYEYGIGRRVHHTPTISPQFGVVSVPERSALKTSGRELSEDVSFGIGMFLVVEQSCLEV